MESPIKNIKLSSVSKDQLLKLKRFTKIENWNVLCRWGFAVSLAEKTIPSPIQVHSDSNVEMDWETFGGEFSDIYFLALKQRMKEDGLPLDNDSVVQQFKLHLYRGISYLASEKLKDISDLVSKSA